jgi:hypothetical protein
MNVFTRICFSFLIVLVMSSHAYLAPEITNYPPLDNTTSSQFVTYLGGRDIDDCDDIAVDAAGFIYLACHSTSKDFPGFKGQKVSDDMDAYVTKLDPRNGKLIYTSRLSGSKYDGAFTIEVTDDGSIFVGGITDSDDFPTTSDAIQRKYGGKKDAFLTKLKPDGQLEYATYLGGAGEDFPTGLVVDRNQRIYLAGQCQSLDFPGLRQIDSTKKGATEDGFIALWKIRESASLRTTLLGGSKRDVIWALAVDHSNNYLYVAGQTQSVDFPVKSAFQEKLNGGKDAILAKYRISDLQVIFATYFGGPGDEMGQGVAVDNAGNPYLAGTTWSEGTPVTPKAFQPKFAGNSDAFITKFDQTAGKLLYSTHLGGTGIDSAGLSGKIFDVDSKGNAWIAGITGSTDFPMIADSPSIYGGGERDGFVTALDQSGSKLVFSRFFGGDQRDILEGLANGVDGSVWATGFTASRNLPIANAIQKVNNSLDIQLPFDAMIFRIR